MSNMSAIGFPITSEDSVKALAAQTALRGEPVPTSHGNINYVRWDVGAGVSLFAQVVSGKERRFKKDLKAQAVGLNPYVDGTARMQVAVREVRWDEDNPFDARILVSADGSEFWLDSPDALASWAGEIAEMQTLHIAALAQSVEVFADAEAHRHAQAGRDAIVPAESFVPTPVAPGTDPTDPGVAISGEVLDAEQRDNAVTERAIWVLKVATAGGQVDVVCSPDDVTGAPRPGTVVQALCYLTARPVQS